MNGQDSTAITAAKWKIRGSISAQLIGYNISGAENRRQNFTWRIAGAPVIYSGDFKMPVFVSLSNLDIKGGQPYNKISLVPTYKWFKGYLGHNRLDFSDYSLNGRTILGAGIEIKPSIIRFSAIAGRLNKSVELDITEPVSTLSSNFNRWGYAIKAGLGSEKNNFDIVFFKAWDDKSSFNIPDSGSNVYPQENLVISFLTHHDITSKISFDLEVAGSGFTRNLNSSESDKTGVDYPLIKSLFTNRISSQYSYAAKAHLNLNFDVARFQLGYERVEPEFYSMGTYYFINDIERYTFSTRLLMARRKIMLFAKAGLENKNLLSLNLADTRRWVGLVNASITPNRNFMLQLNYSNFTMNQQIIRDVFSDSIKLAQISQQASAVAVINFNGGNKRHTLTLNGGMQFLNDKSELEPKGGDFNSSFYRLSYNIHFKPSLLDIKATFHYNLYNYVNRDKTRYGAEISGLKKLDKNKIGLKVGVYQVLDDGQKSYLMVQPGIVGRFKVGKNHTISIKGDIRNKNSSDAARSGFTELQGYITYRLSFR